MLLDLHNSLTPRNWERCLALHPYTVKGWSEEVRMEGIVIDLSKVAWIEPGTLVRCVLFIEKALLDGVAVDIRLPLRRPAIAEMTLLRHAQDSQEKETKAKGRTVSEYIDRRRQARLVLDRMNLRGALTHDHLRGAKGVLNIVEDHDWSRSRNETVAQDPVAETSEDGQGANSPLRWDFNVVYGLQWVPHPQSEEGKKCIEHLEGIDVLADVITHPSRRVSAADGRTLAYVCLTELAENTAVHAGKDYSLVAAWTRPKDFPLRKTSTYACEADFASWCKGYPLVEVIVGDSGLGIPTTLREEYHIRHPKSPATLNNATEEEKIIAWAFDKWSTRLGSSSRRGTRGLYRVARVARKYNGCATLRTEHSCICLDAGTADPPKYFPEEKKLARSPGTLAHIRLPVMLVESLPQRSKYPPLAGTHLEVLDLGSIDWKRQANYVDDVISEVSKACKAVYSDDRAECLIVDLGFADLDRRVLEDLLQHLVLVANPVGIILSGVDGPDRFACEEVIHSIHEQSNRDQEEGGSRRENGWAPKPDPILFRHADGCFTWVAVPEQHSALFEELVEKGEITQAELEKYEPDREKRNELFRDLLDASHIIHRREGGGVSLRFNRENVDQKLQTNVVEKLEGLLYSHERVSGILRGEWITPALEVASPYVIVDKLLGENRLLRPCLRGLALKCAKHSAFQEPNMGVELVSDTRTTTWLLESFARELRHVLQGRTRIGITHLSSGDLPITRDGTIVVLFVDIVFTANLARRLLAQTMRAKCLPELIVSIFDAREDPKLPIKFVQSPFTVLSLLPVRNLSPQPLTHPALRFISPMTYEEESEPSAVQGDYRLLPSGLAQMLEAQKAMYFGHIVRPSGRHFCLYLDPLQLLGTRDTVDPAHLSEGGNTILALFLTVIDEWLGAGKQINLICYPQSERPSETELIASKIGDHYNVPISLIPRGGTALNWKFPLQIDVTDKSQPPPSLFDKPQVLPLDRVVIVDWGSMTGKSIREMIRLVASAGAQNILVVVFLSQLQVDEEESLRLNRVVGVPGHLQCNVEVKFLGRFPLRAYDSLHCPHCRQLRRFGEEERVYPSELFRDLIKRSKLRLKACSLSELREARQEDLKREIPVALMQKDEELNPENHPTIIVEYQDWIERAQRSTYDRLRLYQEFESIRDSVKRKDPGWTLKRACLIRLLAAEWGWLKEEPLDLSCFKEVICEIATELIVDKDRPETERQLAIIVLRTTSKSRFASVFHELFNKIHAENPLLVQLLYCACTYLQREYHQFESLKPMVEALESCSQATKASAQIAVSNNVTHMLNSVMLLGSYSMEKTQMEQKSIIETWRILRKDWVLEYSSHHPAAEALRGLYFGDLPLELISWFNLRQNWVMAKSHFTQLLMMLGILRPLFEELASASVMPRRLLEPILEASTGKGLSRIAEVRTQLDVFVKEPTQVNDELEWKKFVEARDWLWQWLVNPGRREDSSRVDSAPLLLLLNSCPSFLQEVMSSEQKVAESRKLLQIKVGDRFAKDMQVFCHQPILTSFIHEVFHNVEKHIAKPDGGFINVQINIREDLPYVHVQVLNDGRPVPSGGTGQGLNGYRQLLQAYGGELDWGRVEGQTNCFEVNLRILKW